MWKKYELKENNLESFCCSFIILCSGIIWDNDSTNRKRQAAKSGESK